MTVLVPRIPLRILLRTLPAAVLLLLHTVVRAAPCVEPPPDPTNTYDAQHTYDKLLRDYPFIRIASATPPADVTMIADQTYIQYGSRCLKLDLYLPAAAASAAAKGAGAPVATQMGTAAATPMATPTATPMGAPMAAPVVIIVNGGGWRSGFRAEFAPMAVRLAQRGYAAVTISYRLSGEAQYPAAIHDVRAAVRWVRENAAAYHLDPRRIALAGGSAGGQIASLAGVTGHLNQFDPGAAGSSVSSAVQAIVNIDGLSDFTSEAARANEDDPKKTPSSAGAWFGGRYAERTALWQEASPTRYVQPGMPPILFIGSSKPRFSVGREEMAAKMAAAGAFSRTVVLPDTPHSFWMFDPWLQPTVDATVAFLDQQLPPLKGGEVCTAIADAGTGQTLFKRGDCDSRVTPASTFKIAISLMGYDAGFLKDAHTPKLPFVKGYVDWRENWKQPTDPTKWMKDSVVWYSQQVTKSLGKERFAGYTSRFQYGNADVTGDAENDGLTMSWIGSSLRISPVEQTRFLSRLVSRQLGVSKRAYDMTARLTEFGRLPGGWDVHGKTGASSDFGWYVGWATKGARTFTFARLMRKDDSHPQDVPAGVLARDAFIKEFPALIAPLDK